MLLFLAITLMVITAVSCALTIYTGISGSRRARALEREIDYLRQRLSGDGEDHGRVESVKALRAAGVKHADNGCMATARAAFEQATALERGGL